MASKAQQLTERDLHHWRMLDVFEETVARVYARHTPHPSLEDPKRTISYRPYLSLFLFGLFNPVVESMRGLCAISELPRVQAHIGSRRISLATFSEMQHVVDPLVLHEVFQDLARRVPVRTQSHPELAHLKVIAQDGSLWRALPRMGWAEYGVGPDGQAKGVRLHLRFNVVDDKPEDAVVRVGQSCERQALRDLMVPGQVNVGDRYYGLDYQLFADVDQAGAQFVFRTKENAVVHVEQELALTEEDRAAGIIRHAWVRLGAHEAQRSMRVRLVEIRTLEQHLFLVTNLSVEKASAALIGLLYRRRWSVELFFRWIKCILGCRHFFAESPHGVAIQMYLALIASLLFQSYAGHRPTKRIMELIQMYLMGWATPEHVAQALEKHRAARVARKKV